MGMVNQGGKGSAARPFSVSPEEYSKNFDAIFGKKQEDKSKCCDNTQCSNNEKEQCRKNP